MKSLRKTDETQTGINFSVSENLLSTPVHVQGGFKRAYKNVLLIQSGGRYKLETSSVDYLKIISGCGYFKWARGETRFSEGEVFAAEAVGEYEVNGICTFTVVRM